MHVTGVLDAARIEAPAAYVHPPGRREGVAEPQAPAAVRVLGEGQQGVAHQLREALLVARREPLHHLFTTQQPVGAGAVPRVLTEVGERQVEIHPVDQVAAGNQVHAPGVEAPVPERRAPVDGSGGATGDHIHHPSHRTGAVQCGGGTAQHLDPLHRRHLQRGQVVGPRGAAIHQDQRARVDPGILRPEAADGDAGEEARELDHVHRGVLLQDVGDLVGRGPLQIGGGDHVHTLGDLAAIRGRTGHGDGDLLQQVAREGVGDRSLLRDRGGCGDAEGGGNTEEQASSHSDLWVFG
jgi:hypothetical protein